MLRAMTAYAAVMGTGFSSPYVPGGTSPVTGYPLLLANGCSIGP